MLGFGLIFVFLCSFTEIIGVLVVGGVDVVVFDACRSVLVVLVVKL